MLDFGVKYVTMVSYLNEFRKEKLKCKNELTKLKKIIH